MVIKSLSLRLLLRPLQNKVKSRISRAPFSQNRWRIGRSGFAGPYGRELAKILRIFFGLRLDIAGEDLSRSEEEELSNILKTGARFELEEEELEGVTSRGDLLAPYCPLGADYLARGDRLDECCEAEDWVLNAPPRPKGLGVLTAGTFLRIELWTVSSRSCQGGRARKLSYVCS